MSEKIAVFINGSSGSGNDAEVIEAVKAAFAENGVKVTVNAAADGSEVVKLIDAAGKSTAEIIVAGGGDGTISYAAAIAYRTGKTLAVLPFGTLNNFAKDLNISTDIAEAVSVIVKGHISTIDLGEVNGRTFINNSSIGLYPKMVRRREKRQRLGNGKWTSAIWASLRMFKISPFLKVAISIDNKTFVRKTPFVFVGNNEYDVDLYNIGRRASINDGNLSVYFLHKGGRLGVITLLFKTVFGGLKQWRDFEVVKTQSITIRSRKKQLYTAFDGEVELIETPLQYKVLPNALKVITPAPVKLDENLDTNI